jgi:uncharacterized protein YfdQ (DUF2303 family)
MEANNIQAAIDAGKEIGAKPDERIVMVGGLPVLVAPMSMQAKLLHEVVAMEDAREAQPRRLKGTATLTELDSFLAHVNRHKSADSVVFADVAGVKLTAVLNYHMAGSGDDKARWSDHRAVYSCPLSDAWKRWNEHSGEEMSQDDFAQFIEDHMDDLAAPTGNGDDKDLPMPSDVLTMARNLIVNTKGAFQRTVDPVTGNYTMLNKSDNDTGTTKIPRAFKLQLQVFDAGSYWGIQARVRFQLNHGVPCFSYLLYKAEETKREAFDEIRKKVIGQTQLPLFAGSPE